MYPRLAQSFQLLVILRGAHDRDNRRQQREEQDDDQQRSQPDPLADTARALLEEAEEVARAMLRLLPSRVKQALTIRSPMVANREPEAPGSSAGVEVIAQDWYARNRRLDPRLVARRGRSAWVHPRRRAGCARTLHEMHAADRSGMLAVLLRWVILVHVCFIHPFATQRSRIAPPPDHIYSGAGSVLSYRANRRL